MLVKCLRSYAKGSQRYVPGQEYEIADKRADVLIRNRIVRRAGTVEDKAIDKPPAHKMIDSTFKRLKRKYIKRKNK